MNRRTQLGKILLSSLLLISCQAPSENQLPSSNNSPQLKASASPAASASTHKGLTRLSIQGNILMPSGIKQAQGGILLPSGILMPSGILLASGFQRAGFYTQADSTGTTGFNQVRFDVLAYDQLSAELLAQTESDGSGVYLLQGIPAGTRLLLKARARNLDAFVLQAAAELPASSQTQPLIRNISTTTTAAVLLTEAVNATEQERLPLSSLQSGGEFQAKLDLVRQALEQALGKMPVLELGELSAELKDLLAQVRQLVQQRKAQLLSRRDGLDDPSLSAPIDSLNWPRPTHLLGRLPMLPDGTCPAPRPRPDGTPVQIPLPDSNGFCPPQPNGIRHIAPGQPVPAKSDGTCPAPLPDHAGAPVVVPTPNPQQLCPPVSATYLPDGWTTASPPPRP